MATPAYQEIRDSLLQLYLDAPCPWLVGFNNGFGMANGQTLSAFNTRNSNFATAYAVLSVPRDQRTKPVAILCIDPLAEICTVMGFPSCPSKSPLAELCPTEERSCR